MHDESSDDDRDELTSEWGGESRHDWGGWRNEFEFQRRGDAYLNKRSVIFNEERVGGRERVTTDEERVLRGGWAEIRLLTGCKNFVGKIKKLMFNAYYVRWQWRDLRMGVIDCDVRRSYGRKRFRCTETTTDRPTFVVP